jgi:hypothetical protein
MKTFNSAILLAALVACPASLAAQSSAYSVLGLGYPTHPLDVRSRSLGGGVASVAPPAAVNPATAVGFDRLTVVINTEAQFRSFDAGDTGVSGLEETRFPFAMVGGRMWSLPLGFAVSYATYADRTYDITTGDTVTLRGMPVAVSDRQQSRGAITDIRGAVGWLVSSRLAFGVGLHMLAGSAQLNVRRSFDDPYYAPLMYRDREVFQGYGVSLGASIAPVRAFRVGMSVRKDGELDVSHTGEPLGSYTLPTTLSGGFILSPISGVEWSATGIWRSWSEIQDDLVEDRAFDTWFAGTGLEIVDAVLGRPLRIGARYQMLPFSPGEEQPRELTVSLGTGLQFAAARALADVTIEHSFREGAGVTERVWSVSAALALRP